MYIMNIATFYFHYISGLRVFNWFAYLIKYQNNKSTQNYYHLNPINI